MPHSAGVTRNGARRPSRSDRAGGCAELRTPRTRAHAAARALPAWRRLSLVIRGGRAIAGRVGNLDLFAVGTGAVSDADLLLACSHDPERADCALLEFDAGQACRSDPVNAIYCHGFEAL